MTPGFDPALPAAAAATFGQAALAFAIVLAVAVPCGLLLGAGAALDEIAAPWLHAALSVPKVALLPLLVLAFGVGAEVKIAYAVLLGFFPAVLGVSGGARRAAAAWRDLARSCGASRRGFVTAFLLPGAVPSIAVALQAAFVQSLVGVLVAELYVTSGGLAQLLQRDAQGFRWAELGAIYALLFGFALLANAGLARLQRVREP